jgi:hypothetical protein
LVGKTSKFIHGNLIGGTHDRAIGARPREQSMFGIYYYFLKFTIFFSIVKALVKFETLGNHFLFLGILYTSLVAFISYVFILTTEPGSFNANWLLRINHSTGVSPWLIWLAATLVLSTLYFKLLSKFDEGILFWILLILGIAVVIF